jgi:hypothetical protein
MAVDAPSQRAERLAWRPHLPFLIVLGVGAAVRILAMDAYRPALLFPDSADYLNQAHHLSPVN